MGKRGVHPKPTALRVLHGDRKDRINADEPVPSEGEIVPPDYLDDDARGVWDRLAPDLTRKGVLTAWDVDSLAVFCTAVVMHRRAVAYVNDTAVLLSRSERDRGSVVKHPALQVIRDQAAIIRAFGSEFGLSPSARSELATPQSGKSKAERLLS